MKDYYDSGEWSIYYDSSHEEFPMTHEGMPIGRYIFSDGLMISTQIQETFSWDSDGNPYSVLHINDCKNKLKADYEVHKYQSLLEDSMGYFAGPYAYSGGELIRTLYTYQDSEKFNSLVEKIRNIWPEYPESFFKTYPEDAIGTHPVDSCITWYSAGSLPLSISNYFGFNRDSTSEVAHYGLKFDLSNQTRQLEIAEPCFVSSSCPTNLMDDIKHFPSLVATFYDSDKNKSNLIDWFMFTYKQDIEKLCTSKSMTYPLMDSETKHPWAWSISIDTADSANPYRSVTGYIL